MNPLSKIETMDEKNCNFFDIFMAKPKRGRPCITDKFPEIIPLIDRTIQQNGAEAKLKKGYLSFH